MPTSTQCRRATNSNRQLIPARNQCKQATNTDSDRQPIPTGSQYCQATNAQRQPNTDSSHSILTGKQYRQATNTERPPIPRGNQCRQATPTDNQYRQALNTGRKPTPTCNACVPRQHFVIAFRERQRAREKSHGRRPVIHLPYVAFRESSKTFFSLSNTVKGTKRKKKRLSTHTFHRVVIGPCFVSCRHEIKAHCPQYETSPTVEMAINTASPCQTPGIPAT